MMLSRTVIVIAGVAVLGLSGGVQVAAGQPTEKRIKATGVAEGTGLQAKDEALLDAKSQAVMRACGTFIDASTLVENFQLINERILTHATGYITECKVEREWVEEGMSHCTILATVQVARLQDDWAQFRQLKEHLGNPRCLIVIAQDRDATNDLVEPELGGAFEARLKNLFLKQDVPVVDQDVSDWMRERDVQLANLKDNITGLAAYAARLDADLLIYGEARAIPKGSAPVPNTQNMTSYRFELSATLKVVQADTARTLATDAYPRGRVYKRGSTGAACPDEAFRELADKVAEELLRDIEDAWRKQATSYSSIVVFFEGCSHSDWVDKLEPALREFRGVRLGAKGVQKRSLVSNVLEVEIYWRFDLDNLEKKIAGLELPGMTFEITESLTNRLRVKVHHE